MATKTSDMAGYKPAVKYDLGTFVVSVNRLKKQGKPFMIVLNFVWSVLSWKYPIVTIILMPATTLMILFMPEYLLAFFLIPIPMLMLVTLVKNLGTSKATINDYHHLFVRKDESPQLLAKKTAMLKAQEHLEMYLDILIEIQDLCNEISNKCEYLYNLIYWKAWKQALLFYLIILGIIFGLFTINARELASIFLFCVSIFNPGFKNAIKDGFNYLWKIPSSMSSKKTEVMVDAFDNEIIEEIEHKDYDMQVKESFPIAEEAESSSSTDSEELTLKPESKQAVNVNFQPNQERQRERSEKSGLSFVSKFASSTLASITRRRRHGGNCASCDVQFSTILKKRNYCRHCGYSYCSKCCHQRVPKVVFGATAPAAYEERVLVCKSCYAFLMNRIRGTNTEIVE